MSPLALLSTEGSTKSPDFFRTVARLGIQAAEALEHAHQMGVVHRDIKPSNLMVEFPLPSPLGRGAEFPLPSPLGRGAGGEGAGGEGRGGEGRGGEGPRLWITDFGLARIHTPTPLRGEGRGEGGRGEGASLTMTGDVLGTLRYMSPEQLQAKHGVLDHRTDVYSLGLTLYELMTLQPAFPGDDRQDLIRQIAEDDPRPPRQLNKSIPKDLETIILKATAKEPQSRYATAQQLADDLRRFLSDEPIRARRPTLVQRCAKWSRRHKWGVSMAIAGAFLLTLACGGFLWHGKTREARERRRAEQNLRWGVQAVDQIHFEYFKGRRSQFRARTSETEEFLEKLLVFYERFAHSNPSDLSVRRSIAKAYGRLGQVQSELKAHEKAEATWQRATEIVQELVSRVPDDPDSRKCLADIYFLRGESYWRSGKYDKAIAACNEAIRIWPGHALAFGARGWAYGQKGNWEQGVADLSEQIRLEPDYAWAYYTRGCVYASRDPDQAISDFTKAIQLDPKLGSAYSRRGEAYANKGEFDKAIDDHDKAVGLFRRTASVYDPYGVEYYLRRAVTYSKKGDAHKAIADLDEAILINPESDDAYRYRALAHAKLGQIEAARSDLAEMQRIVVSGPGGMNNMAWFLVTCSAPALWDADRAVELAAEAVRLSPSNSACWNTLGVARYRAGQWKESISALEKSSALKGNHSYNFFFLAMAHWQLGDKDQARQWYDKAVKWMEKNQPEDEELRRFRAEAAELLGVTAEAATEETKGTKAETH